MPFLSADWYFSLLSFRAGSRETYMALLFGRHHLFEAFTSITGEAFLFET